MDCKTALRILEVCRPADDDLADSTLATATAHLEACPDCLSHFRGRQSFDERVAMVVQSEPVPAGLRERIHARLDRAQTRRRYRHVAIWSGAAAAVVLVSASVFLWSSHIDQPTVIAKSQLVQLEDFADTAIDEQLDFQTSPDDPEAIKAECADLLRQLNLPIRWPYALRLEGLYAVGRTRFFDRPVAVFRFRDPRGSCDVLALPQSHFVIADLQAGKQLIDRPTRNIVLIAWTEEDATYAAVLKDWSPRDWKPLVDRSGRLM
jgi:hypothetical protein